MKACPQKYVDALERCGCVCELQSEGLEVALLRDASMEQCRKLAESGDSQTQFDLGCMHFDGEDRNWEQALLWWRKAAEQGARGGETEALLWFRKAAESFHDVQKGLDARDRKTSSGWRSWLH